MHLTPHVSIFFNVSKFFDLSSPDVHGEEGAMASWFRSHDPSDDRCTDAANAARRNSRAPSGDELHGVGARLVAVAAVG